MPVSLYYSAKDIRELERKGRERNDYLSALISNIRHFRGDRISDRLMNSTVYELCVREHKAQSKKTKINR